MCGCGPGLVSVSVRVGNMDGHARTIPRRSVVRMEDLVANDVQHAINPSKTRRIIITFRHQVFHVCVCVCTHTHTHTHTRERGCALRHVPLFWLCT